MQGLGDFILGQNFMQVRKLRMVTNPRSKSGSRRAAPKKRARSSSNPFLGGGELIVMANKHRSTKKKKSYSRNPKRHSSSKRNGAFGFRRKTYRRHSNPAFAGGSMKEVFVVGLGAAAGAVGPRAITQLVLGDKYNSGFTGYGVNLVIGGVLAWGAAKFFGKNIGLGVAAGTIAGVLMRFWSEKISMISPAAALSGLGDPDFSGTGMGHAQNALGAYIQTAYNMPGTSHLENGYLIANNPWQLNAAPAGAAATPAPPARRNVDRFAPR